MNFQLYIFFKFTRHAGCPILFGPKWVRKLNKIAKIKEIKLHFENQIANKWIGSKGQTFHRKC